MNVSKPASSSASMRLRVSSGSYFPGYSPANNLPGSTQYDSESGRRGLVILLWELLTDVGEDLRPQIDQFWIFIEKEDLFLSNGCQLGLGRQHKESPGFGNIF